MDSGDPELLHRWMDEGALPALASLRAGSTALIATAPAEMGNGEMWLTMLTGVGMGRHGINYIKQLRPGSYVVDPMDEDRDCKARPIWERMSAAGKHCIVLDMFRAPLSPAINGIQVNDWYAHFRTLKPRSIPPQAIANLETRYGADPFDGNADMWFFRNRDYRQLIDLSLQMIDRKTDALEAYMDGQPWDVLMAAYAEAHNISHICWHIRDPRSDKHDPALHQSLGDPLQTVCERIDGGIARLLARTTADDTIVFFAGLGFQNFYSIGDLFDRLLRQLDDGAASGPRAAAAARSVRASVLKRILPAPVRRLASRALYRATETLSADDRKQRRFFAVPCEGHAGAVRINLVGREPEGKVAPEHYAATIDALERDLLAIVNAETGEPLVDHVVRTRDRYPGPYVDGLPDLFIVWNRRKPIRVVSSPKVGEMRIDLTTLRTGDHVPESLVMVKGPHIPVQRLERRVTPEDVGATLLALAGCETSDLDGHPIAELVGRVPQPVA